MTRQPRRMDLDSAWDRFYKAAVARIPPDEGDAAKHADEFGRARDVLQQAIDDTCTHLALLEGQGDQMAAAGNRFWGKVPSRIASCYEEAWAAWRVAYHNWRELRKDGARGADRDAQGLDAGGNDE